MPALQSARFYRDAIAHWPKCFIEQFKRGQEMTDRLVFIGTLGSLVAGLVGTWLTKSPAPTGTESGLVDSLKAISPWVALGSLALLVLLSFLASVRKEHETRLSGANDAANKKLSGYASANLALRQRAE